MFSGIIENIGEIINIESDFANFNILIQSNFTQNLSIGESVAHNGVCLTVTHIDNNLYKVNCVKETLIKTNLGILKIGDKINLERSLKVNSRISGHFVQGHVDCLGKCCFINKESGNIFFKFQYPKKFQNLIFEKGSICVNGASLTISKINDDELTFEVCIIPHTLNETTFQFMKEQDKVNLEFDMISKQINRNLILLKL
tara:strand:+ start:264 stop:863 length:600 start_codon:yes stop_codon:yes gene_type:complete